MERVRYIEIFVPSTKESVAVGKEHYRCKGELEGPKCFSSISHDNQKVSDVGPLSKKTSIILCESPCSILSRTQSQKYLVKVCLLFFAEV